MTPETFKAWRAHRRLSRREAADALGVSVATIVLYEAGKRRAPDNRPVVIPKTVALACSAIAQNLPPYGTPIQMP